MMGPTNEPSTAGTILRQVRRELHYPYHRDFSARDQYLETIKGKTTLYYSIDIKLVQRIQVVKRLSTVRIETGTEN